MNVIFLISSIRNGLRPTIPDELQSNVTVLKDMIDVRNGGKVCESLGMDDVQFIINNNCIN